MTNQNIIFESEKHKTLFYTLLKKCRRVNDEATSVMYLLALACDNEAQAKQMFDFKENCICPENLSQPWQTGSTERAVRLAFVLWNGYPSEENQTNNSIYNIFGYSSWDRYFIEAIKLRYPATAKES